MTVPKGPAQIAAVLGILAAGGVYVPVGADRSSACRELIADVADVRFAVAGGETGEWPAGLQVVSMARLGHAPLSGPVGVRASDPAYVIFTSNPDGQFNGVEISHRSAVNTVEDVNDRFGVDSGDRVLAVSSADSDLSVYDIFGLLSAGGALVLPDGEADARRWVTLCHRYGVTVWNSGPEVFADYLSAAQALEIVDELRLALVSGARVGPELPDRFRQRCPRGKFIVLGGATEAAIWSNAFEVDRVRPEWLSVPQGFALRNQRCRVVDAAGRDCPDWVSGELWIGGSGVAEGYRGDPIRSAEKFVRWAGSRWYRTGDLGRFWPDGTLEYLGPPITTSCGSDRVD
jgi:non-ribosomal peptide synthetase component F